ncbi:hypothetical protein QQF64_030360 [Cirrhinus molitorella]|uniref:Uncharacterized protein n=1 Tax=Cirrhinus molitorella TaxID=172907 RepID=A0ABR3N383_9TELE
MKLTRPHLVHSVIPPSNHQHAPSSPGNSHQSSDHRHLCTPITYLYIYSPPPVTPQPESRSHVSLSSDPGCTCEKD